MPSPFPGIDPYLELPALWPEFHNRLIVAISDALTPRLQPKYYVAVEARVYLDDEAPELLVGIPDAMVLSSARSGAQEPSRVATEFQPQQIQLPTPIEVKERYLEVREVETHDVITVIEVLSPKNKRNGEGRRVYQKKRQQILASLSHFIEIDFLRANPPMPMLNVEKVGDYRILVSRASMRPAADLYSFELREKIPAFGLPLKPEDPEVKVDLQTIVHAVYKRGSYQFRIDYTQPVPPPELSAENQQWVSELTAQFSQN